MSFERFQINLTCIKQSEEIKDIFEIFGQIFINLEKYDFGYQKLELDIRNNFDFECNGKINSTYSLITDNRYLKTICITSKKENLTYNVYHAFGHFIQNEILTKQRCQNIYQQYLQKSDIFNLPHDYSIIENECVPQLVAHYFCEELNSQAKKFVQDKILK